MNHLIHEDHPLAYWRLPYRQRFAHYHREVAGSMHILPIVVAIFFVGIFLATQAQQDTVIFSILGVTFFLIIAIGFALFPTKYQIFNGRIRIVLGWVLHFDIPFSNIANVTAATSEDLWGLNLNFINSYSDDDILQIIRKRGAKVHITPWDRKLFLEHLNKALADYR